MNNFCSKTHWENRYSRGGNSGKGSQGKLLDFKAMVINDYIRKYGIKSVIDLGCGDGALAYQLQCRVYLGYDVSQAAVNMCKAANKRGSGKYFFLYEAYCGEVGDLALSCDVIYHLVEDQVFEDYMATLFGAANDHIIIYSSNNENNAGVSQHVRHRLFTKWVKNNRPDWELVGYRENNFSFYKGNPNGSYSDFYFYRKKEGEHKC